MRMNLYSIVCLLFYGRRTSPLHDLDFHALYESIFLKPISACRFSGVGFSEIQRRAQVAASEEAAVIARQAENSVKKREEEKEAARMVRFQDTNHEGRTGIVEGLFLRDDFNQWHHKTCATLSKKFERDLLLSSLLHYLSPPPPSPSSL